MIYKSATPLVRWQCKICQTV